MTGFVYFIGPKDWRVGVVKIGVTSSHPRKRLKSFQTGSPAPLEIYGYVEGDWELESQLHSIFAPVRSHGEWFRTDGKLLALIGDIYFLTFGQRPLGQQEFLDAIDHIALDDPPHPDFCGEEEWIDSVDGSALSGWRGDIAWASHLAQQGRIQ